MRLVLHFVVQATITIKSPLMPAEIAVPPGVVAEYQRAFRAHGRTEQTLGWSKNKQSVRFAALCADIPNAPTRLLDYGCGFGDLGVWLKDHRPAIDYLGVDAVPEFVADNQAARPDLRFALATHPDTVADTFDDVVCCGVFNLRPDGTDAERWTYVQAMLSALFGRVRRTLHVDFLAPDVDFKHPQGYHQDIHELVAFVQTKLSRRFRLDRTYMPYEFCISIYADRTVDRARNVYAPLHEQPNG